MQNEQLLDVVQGAQTQPSTGVGPSTPQQSGTIDLPEIPPPRERTTPIPLSEPTLSPDPTPTPAPAATKANSRSGKLRLFVIIGVIIAMLGITALVFALTSDKPKGPASVSSGAYSDIKLPLDGFTLSNTADSTTSLNINGQLNLSSSVVLTPSKPPKNPVTGQMYFDQTLNQLLYYDGQKFVAAGANQAGANINNSTTTNTTNIFNSGGGAPQAVDLQASAPGVQQTGNFNISGTGQAGALKTPSLTSDSTLDIQSNSSATLTTAAGSGTTGGITIKTGDSSTTASGNITIDSGNGVIDGTVVSHKSFEGGVDGMQAWFSTSIAQTTEQAHDGISSLGVTITGPFGWGIIEDQGGPGTPVTPGHQYFFSFWVRAKTTPRNIGITIDWTGSGVTSPLTTTTDSTTQWQEVTGLITAPAGATKAYFHAQSGSGTAGEVHYFDDITITDLSSGSAVSSIDIGSTNAKIITIGNLNQVGATTIRGGSGIDIQSGSAGTAISGGTVNITGNAASTINTTSGALAITSATSTTWGINTASTGAGGDLTLKAGSGAFGNNNGGSLILQGGAGTGTGLGGSVVVKPLTDSTNVFQIQNSAGTSLFVADAANLRMYVGDPAGSASAVVLVLSNQTTASDPTGVNGAMYYNSSLGKFRCYQQQWRDCIGDDIINTYRYSNEFGNTLTGTTGADNTLLSSFSGAGAGAPNAGGEVKHPGISGLNTGTTSTGSAAYMSGIPGGSTTLRLGNSVAWTFRSAVRVNTLSTGTDTHTTRVGFIDSNSGESTDGCFFRYTDSVNGGRWQGVCRDNNTESTCDTGIAVTAATWKTMEIGVAADASTASFVISGVQRCTISTNIPTASGRNTGFGFSIIKSAGTAAAQIDIDYVDIRATGSGFGSRE